MLRYTFSIENYEKNLRAHPFHQTAPNTDLIQYLSFNNSFFWHFYTI